MMTVGSLLKSEAAPFACCGSVFVASVQLNILYGMAETELIDTCASGSVAIDLNNGEGINQLLSVCLVRFHRYLETIGVVGLILELVLRDSKVTHLGQSHTEKGRSRELSS
jgi:hypothetical protein